MDRREPAGQNRYDSRPPGGVHASTSRRGRGFRHRVHRRRVLRHSAHGSRGRPRVDQRWSVLDWSLAVEVADLIGLDWDEDDVEEFEPVGDLQVCADFGLDTDELLMICQDEDLLPDEQVRAVAKRMGFGAELSAVLRSR